MYTKTEMHGRCGLISVRTPKGRALILLRSEARLRSELAKALHQRKMQDLYRQFALS